PGHELPGDGGVDARPVRRGGLLLQILGADLAVSARGELLQSVEHGPPVVHGGLQGAQPPAVEFFHRQPVGRHVPQASADVGAQYSLIRDTVIRSAVAFRMPVTTCSSSLACWARVKSRWLEMWAHASFRVPALVFQASCSSVSAEPMSRPALKRSMEALCVLGRARAPSTLSRSRRSSAMFPSLPNWSSCTTRSGAAPPPPWPGSGATRFNCIDVACFWATSALICSHSSHAMRTNPLPVCDCTRNSGVLRTGI